MRNSHLNKVIETLTKRKNKLLYINDLKEILALELANDYSDKKWYKIIYHLKNKGYLVSLKKDIFFITTPGQLVKESEIVEQYYRSILHNHCNTSFNKRYIGWIKALEIGISNYDIPDQILIINTSKQATDIVVTNKSLHAKTYTSQWKNLFKAFIQFSTKQKIGKLSFPLACKELAILECLFSYDDSCDRYSYELIKKIVKKHDLDLSILEWILSIGKHHTSINRLVEILKISKPKLVEPVMKLIKKYSFVLSI